MTVRQKVVSVVKRSLAALVSAVFAVVGGAQILGGWPVWKSAALAAIAVIAQIIEGLARAARDGNVTDDEIDEVFDGLD